MNLLDLHGVRRIDESGLRYSGAIQSCLPSLNIACIDWFSEEWKKVKKDFRGERQRSEKLGQLVKDLIPTRIGALDGNLSRCIPVSWAAVMQMIKENRRLRIPRQEWFKALAIIFLIVTRDRKLVLIRRSDKVAQYKGFYHLSATGYIDAETVLTHGLWDGIVETVFKEAKEELDLERGQIIGLRSEGTWLITGADSANIDFAFTAKTDLTGEEVLALARKAKDSWEGKHRLVEKDEAVALLQQPTLVPSAAGCLTRYFGL